MYNFTLLFHINPLTSKVYRHYIITVNGYFLEDFYAYL